MNRLFETSSYIFNIRILGRNFGVNPLDHSSGGVLSDLQASSVSIYTPLMFFNFIQAAGNPGFSRAFKRRETVAIFLFGTTFLFTLVYLWKKHPENLVRTGSGVTPGHSRHQAPHIYDFSNDRVTTQSKV